MKKSKENPLKNKENPLKKARIALGYTQGQMAEFLGLSRYCINRYEGESIGFLQLSKIQRLERVGIDPLLFFDPDVFPLMRPSDAAREIADSIRLGGAS